VLALRANWARWIRRGVRRRERLRRGEAVRGGILVRFGFVVVVGRELGGGLCWAGRESGVSD